MCFYNDGNYDSRFLGKTMPKSSKARPCFECQEEIPVGDAYVRYAFVMDGKAYNTPVCLKCELIRDLIKDKEMAEGCREHESICPIGEIWDYMEERNLAYDAQRNELLELQETM